MRVVFFSVLSLFFAVSPVLAIYLFKHMLIVNRDSTVMFSYVFNTLPSAKKDAWHIFVLNEDLFNERH
jgi:hypothetical protein